MSESKNLQWEGNQRDLLKKPARKPDQFVQGWGFGKEGPSWRGIP